VSHRQANQGNSPRNKSPAVDPFYTATNRRSRGALWSIFAPALIPRDDARVYPDDFKAGRSPTFNPAVKILEEAMRAGELRPDDPIEIAFELGALQHGLILLYRGGRVAQTEKQFRKLHQRSFRRYLNALRP